MTKHSGGDYYLFGSSVNGGQTRERHAHRRSNNVDASICNSRSRKTLRRLVAAGTKGRRSQIPDRT